MADSTRQKSHIGGKNYAKIGRMKTFISQSIQKERLYLNYDTAFSYMIVKNLLIQLLFPR